MTSKFNVDFASFVNSKKQENKMIDNVEYAYASDRAMRQTFKYIKPVEWAMDATIRYWKNFEKNSLLGSSIKVNERQFPRINSLLKTASNTLSIAKPDMYITSSPHINASTFGTNDDSFILLYSAIVDHLSDEELLDVIGHECGHIQNSHVTALTTLYFLTNIASIFSDFIVYPAKFALLALSRRMEITADRAGMLVCKDFNISQRSLIKLAVGSQKLYDQIDVDAYLEQYEEGKTGIGRVSELFMQHPYLPKRCMSLKAFDETEVYRKHLNLAGGISMQDCDKRVHSIITVA